MIFSTDRIPNNKNKKIEESNIEYIDFFFKALELSLESSSELIYELDNLDLSHGIVDNIYSLKIRMFDPSEAMNNILERLENNCNDLLDNYLKYFCKSLDSEELKKIKNKLPKKYKSIIYPNSIYVFKNLSSNTVYLNNISKLLIANYERLEDFINMLKGEREEDLIRNLNKIMLDKDVNRMNSVRGFLLGKDRIEEDKYADELFNFFRSEKTKINSILDEARVEKAYENIFNNSNVSEVIKRENSKFIDLMKDIISHVKSFSIGDRIKSEEGILLYNNIISDYCKEIDEISNIYLMYIGAKLDAIKEYNEINIDIIKFINGE